MSLAANSPGALAMQPLGPSDPAKVGRYTLLGRLGSGGMGVVYLGRSPGNRLVAAKTIHREYAEHPEFRTRFAREVAAARQVSGAFTAPVLDADPHAELPWLAAAYIPGPTLREAVNTHGPFPEHSSRILAAALTEALVDIHRCQLVHRDLKPSNVLLAEDGPRVLDFGIARATDGLDITGTGAMIGTPGYFSPEQVQGEELDARSDVFSLGALLVFASSGRPAFGTGTAVSLLQRVCNDAPDLDSVPSSLRLVLRSCLEKDRQRRPTPEEILDLLGDSATGTAWLPPPVTTMIADTAAMLGELTEPRGPTRRESHPSGPPQHDPAPRAVDTPRPEPPRPAFPAAPGVQAWPARAELAAPAVPDLGAYRWWNWFRNNFWWPLLAVLLVAAVPVVQWPVSWFAWISWQWAVYEEPLESWVFMYWPEQLAYGYALVNILFGSLAALGLTLVQDKRPGDRGALTACVISAIGTLLILRLWF